MRVSRAAPALITQGLVVIKKDYGLRGFARGHARRKLYIFIHFRRRRFDFSFQLDLELFSLIVGKSPVCKSCDHFLF